MKEIESKDLLSNNFPNDINDYQKIIDFAHTFDGYEYAGSHEELKKLAADFNVNRMPNDMDLIRACLFFEIRQLRHWGTDPTAEHFIELRMMVERVKELSDLNS